MTDTTHIGLPRIEAAQAQKHVTYNEALQVLDALVQLAVLARDVNTPPLAPVEGARYIIGASPTGVFAGHAKSIATSQDGAWRFLPPRAGWLVYVEADSALRVFDGTLWREAGDALPNINNLQRFGLATTADATNPLSVKLNATLFAAKATGEGGTGDLRFNLNKSAPANVVSQLYQDNYSGRAETGLIGDNHYRVKVSADGSTWREAIDVDPASGIVSFPSGAGAGSLAGFRNRILNGNFAINQRDHVSGAALAAGAYAHDRWKAGAGGATYSFTAASPDSTAIIASGTLIQVVEGVNIEGGTYVLSWSGAAQGRVNGSAYGASPLVVSGIAAGANITIEFNAGAFGKVQFEPGAIATPFERRHPAFEQGLCRRYCQVFTSSVLGTLQLTAYVGSAGYVAQIFPYPAQMRATPTATILGTWVGANFTGQPVLSADRTHAFLYVSSAGAGVVQCYAPVNGGFKLEAEL